MALSEKSESNSTSFAAQQTAFGSSMYRLLDLYSLNSIQKFIDEKHCAGICAKTTVATKLMYLDFLCFISFVSEITSSQKQKTLSIIIPNT